MTMTLRAAAAAMILLTAAGCTGPATVAEEPARAVAVFAGVSLGVALTVLGVGLALGEKLALPGPAQGGWIGELAVFASALSGATCSVLYRPYLRKYPTLQVGAFAMFASVLFLAVPAAWEGFFDMLPSFTAGGWLAVLFIGVSSGIGYYLWLWALRHTTPTKVSVFLALSPITATALGWAFLSEDISVWFLAGCIRTPVEKNFTNGHGRGAIDEGVMQSHIDRKTSSRQVGGLVDAFNDVTVPQGQGRIEGLVVHSGHCLHQLLPGARFRQSDTEKMLVEIKCLVVNPIGKIQVEGYPKKTPAQHW